MRGIFVLIGAMAILSAMPAGASASDYEPGRVVRSVDLQDLEAVVASLEHAVEKTGISGSNSLRALDNKGVRYLLIGTACDKKDVPDCQGVSIQVRFSSVSGATMETVARANYLYAAVSTWSDEDFKTVGFTRYVVVDHGITMANLRENVRVLLSVSARALEIVKGREAPSSGN